MLSAVVTCSLGLLLLVLSHHVRTAPLGAVCCLLPGTSLERLPASLQQLPLVAASSPIKDATIAALLHLATAHGLPVSVVATPGEQPRELRFLGASLFPGPICGRDAMENVAAILEPTCC